MRRAVLVFAAAALAGCATVGQEAANWTGRLTYDPATGRWAVEFSRPGELPAPVGLAK